MDLVDFVMGGGQLVDSQSTVDLSSWLDNHDDVNSLLEQLSDSTKDIVVSDSEGSSPAGGDSPDVDVGGPECSEVVVPETPDGSESDGDESDGSESCSDTSACSDSGSDSDASSVLSDTSMDYSCDEVFLPNDASSSSDSDGEDGTSTCEVGDPTMYSDISDAEEDEGGENCEESVRKSPAAGVCEYSDISSDEDESEYVMPGSSPARPRFDYPDTDGHIGNWLPMVYGAPWIHDDPTDCAETDVNCSPFD